MKNNKLRRILAWIGIILLLGMYASVLVFALMDNPLARGLLMGSIFCTIAVPVILYGILLAAKVLSGSGAQKDTEDASDPKSADETNGEGPQ